MGIQDVHSPVSGMQVLEQDAVPLEQVIVESGHITPSQGSVCSCGSGGEECSNPSSKWGSLRGSVIKPPVGCVHPESITKSKSVRASLVLINMV